jgi:hypothetical protein
LGNPRLNVGFLGGLRFFCLALFPVNIILQP